VQKNCGFKCKTKGSLTRHIKQKHQKNTGPVQIFKCGEKDCKFETKYKHSLRGHKWYTHNQGKGRIYNCEQENCTYKCKVKGSMKIHLLGVHHIGDIQILKCDEKDCAYECKTKNALKSHKWQKHGKGNKKWFICDQENCEYKCKTNACLKSHLWLKHNSNIDKKELFICTKENCTFKSKQKGSLKRHLSRAHDIGEIQCQLCYKNVSCVTKYMDPKTKKSLNICRDCYNKATGYSTRAEKQMVEHLQKDPKIGPFIALKDAIVKGESCSTRRRPDLLIASSNDLYLIVECDEKQHKGYDKQCEEGRMDEILDELPGGRVVIIRWNPDIYKVDGKRSKTNRKERLAKLSETVLRYIDMEHTEDDHIRIVYMYYDADNELITDRFTKEIIV
jgi:hypothetical protein